MDLFRLGSDENYDRICGQILFTSKGRLAYYCTLCGKYWNYEAFIVHLLEKCSQLDNDLKACITKKSLTGSTHTLFASFPNKCQANQDKPMKVKQLATLTNIKSTLQEKENRKKDKIVVQSVQTLVPPFTYKQLTADLIISKDLSQFPSTSNAQSDAADTEVEVIDISDLNGFDSKESTVQEFIEIEYCNESDQYINYECLEDEQFGEHESQNSYVFEKTEVDILTDDLQVYSKNIVDSKEEPEQTVEGIHNNLNLVDDTVTIPLVVRNVQTHKKYFPSHINQGERKFQCPVCGAAFKNRANRDNHVIRHTNNKCFSCPDCDKKFYTKTEVKIHSKIHEPNREHPFLCTECGLCFISNFKLHKHLKRHTNQRDYICEICDKGFYELPNLKAHMTIHSATRPYSCKICSADFKLHHILKAHMKQHENKRAYKCKLCEAAFNVQAALHSHMKSKHNKYISLS